MAELQRFPLITTNGETGFVLRRARFIDPAEQSRVILDDGTELIAPANSLEPQTDGSFLFHRHPEEHVRTESRTEPQSRQPEPVAPLREPVNAAQETHHASTSDALYADEIGIERVAMNQIVDEAPSNRQEGDVLVIPVVEEILVVQKRYLIKEEIRINRSRHQVAEPRRIVLDGVQTRS